LQGINPDLFMKISNETKIGALTAIAIAFLIMGFNFLKGKNLLKSGNYIYAKYNNTKKLVPSSPVYINGFQVGTVNDIESDDDVRHVTISIKLNDSYNIPTNSIAYIESSLIGSPNIIILPGNSTAYLKNNDTIQTTEKGDLISQVSDKIGPVTDKVNHALSSLDTVLQNINSIMDPNTKGNLKSVIDNLSTASASIVVSVISLQQMLDKQNGALGQSFNNMNSFTQNLAQNNNKIDSIMSNLQTTTDHLAASDVDGVINNLKASVEKLDDMLAKINSTDGTLGSLIHSKELYNSLNNSVISLNTLIDDLRVHPKRYVNISIFGKKDKGDYLEKPLNDSTPASNK